MSEQADEQEPEAERIESLDQRFGEIERTQAEQGGKLDQILTRLSGEAAGKGPAHAAAQQHTRERLGAGSSIADQVRKAVEAVGAEKSAKEQADQHERDHQALKELREHQPREQTSGWRGKLQRAMYGGDR